MRKLIAGLVVVVGLAFVMTAGPVIVWAQGISSALYPSVVSITSTAPSGQNGFACQVNGCRFDLGSGTSDYFDSNGSSIRTPGDIIANGLNVGGGGLKNDNFGAAPFVIRGSPADNASAISVKISSTTALTTAGAKLACFYSDSAVTEKRCVDKDGADVHAAKCDNSASPGNATCNQAAGQAAIAAAAATVTITNSLVVTTSIVTAVLQFSDATCVAVKSVVPGTGSFTINTAAACTSNTKVGWIISSK